MINTEILLYISLGMFALLILGGISLYIAYVFFGDMNEIHSRRDGE